jgi:hypothetical protein
LLSENLVVISQIMFLVFEFLVLQPLPFSRVVGSLAIALHTFNSSLFLFGFRLGPLPGRKVGSRFWELLPP